ncbi:hypothetical protein IJD44_03970 [bacterium]|nr:hypothetical protein [bacterium]
MRNITSLYPQYKISQDRRQQNIPVAVERRSGRDRRSTDRVQLDTQLTRDIFQVKEQVAKLEALSPKFFEANVTTKPPTFGSMNNLANDQLVKQAKPVDIAEIERKQEELKDRASLAFQVGVIGGALAFGVAISFMSNINMVIALTTAVYIGGRILKALIARELQDDNSSKKVK